MRTLTYNHKSTKIQQNSAIVAWSADFNPNTIYKEDALLAKSMQSVSLNDKNTTNHIILIIKNHHLTPSAVRLLSYLLSLDKFVLKDNKHWNFITRLNLCKNIGLKCPDTIRRAIRQLEKLDLLEVTNKYNSKRVKDNLPNNTLWFNINRERLAQLFSIETIKLQELAIEFLRYANNKNKNMRKKNNTHKEKAIVTTAGIILARTKDSIIRKRFINHGKKFSWTNISKNNRKYYFYQNPMDNSKKLLAVKEKKLDLLPGNKFYKPQTRSLSDLVQRFIPKVSKPPKEYYKNDIKTILTPRMPDKNDYDIIRNELELHRKEKENKERSQRFILNSQKHSLAKRQRSVFSTIQ